MPTMARTTSIYSFTIILFTIVCLSLSPTIESKEYIYSSFCSVVTKPLKTMTIVMKASTRRSGDDDNNGEALLKKLNLQSKPKKFSLDPIQILDVTTASVPAVVRLGSGLLAEGYRASIIPRDDSKYTVASFGKYQIQETCSSSSSRKPYEPLILYEFESCPFCRKVREAISILSLDVTYKPCPRNGLRYRRFIKQQFGSSATFPYLIDPNTSVDMFESDRIITYLFKTYGDGIIPSSLSSSSSSNNNNNNNNNVPGSTITAGLGLLPRFGKGGTYKNSNPPKLPLRLWSVEGSPYSKIVREELCAMELAHTQISCPRGSPNRQKLFDLTGGIVQFPYLEDPNTGVAMFESRSILEYISKVYGVKPTPVNYL